MGVYRDYLSQQLGFRDVERERKEQLKRISNTRGGRDVLVYAADLNKGNGANSIRYDDLLPIADELEDLSGNKLDLILETPGGSGEVAEDIVRLLQDRYTEVAVIVPGYAKSAGTIMTMAADEILMGPTSALGPIDAQLFWQGKSFSADALLQGFEKIKNEVASSGVLNKAYIPILQGISPGELESAENALKFAKVLVTEWLATRKFRLWTHHSSTGAEVTDETRRQRADEIAAKLCDHSHWLTHGRSLRIQDLEGLRLKITNYGSDPELSDAIRRYYALLQMTFATNCYKQFETIDSQIYKFIGPAAQLPQPSQGGLKAALDVQCNKCGNKSVVQANLDQDQPIDPGSLPFPKDDKFVCPACGTEADLANARRQLEAQTGKRVVGMDP